MRHSETKWLVDMGNEESNWVDGECDFWPSMIVFAYKQLHQLAIEGNVYGFLLQCRDLYEIIMKVPTMMALVIIENSDENKGDVYAELLRRILFKPMSMGDWESLAGFIVGRKKPRFSLPEALVGILKKTRKLYVESNAVNWRNEIIGHGALKFQDDQEYKEWATKLISSLRNYFSGEVNYSICDEYRNNYFFAESDVEVNRMTGINYMVGRETGDMYLRVEDHVYSVEPYGLNTGACFFDSFYQKPQITRYLSYVGGHEETLSGGHFANLYQQYIRANMTEETVEDSFVTRYDEERLEYLNSAPRYEKPEFLINGLSEIMDELEKGVITICMERGTGKSALAYYLDGQYHKTGMLKNAVVRSYHAVNAQIRGKSDFINSMNVVFKRSYDAGEDIRGASIKNIDLREDSVSPAEDMAKMLSAYQEYYERKRCMENIVLVIDGIDELTEETKFILDWIPASSEMAEGIFIVLLTRFSNEESVSGSSRENIRRALTVSDRIMEIRRSSQENIRLLKSFIEKEMAFSDPEQTNLLLQKTDFRFLYLKAYIPLWGRTDLSNAGPKELIRDYMEYVLSMYNEKYQGQLRQLAVMLAALQPLSIREYKDYLGKYELTYHFIGFLNDLLPLLTVTHRDGEDYYEFADVEYVEFVLDTYVDDFSEVIRLFKREFVGNIDRFYKWQERMERNPNNPDMMQEINVLISRNVFYADKIARLWRVVNNRLKQVDVFYDNNFIEKLFIYSEDVMVTDPRLPMYWIYACKDYGCYLMDVLLQGLEENCPSTLKNAIKHLGLIENDKLRENANSLFFLAENLFDENENDFPPILKELMKKSNKGDDVSDWFWLFFIRRVKYFVIHIDITSFDENELWRFLRYVNTFPKEESIAAYKSILEQKNLPTDIREWLTDHIKPHFNSKNQLAEAILLLKKVVYIPGQGYSESSDTVTKLLEMLHLHSSDDVDDDTNDIKKTLAHYVYGKLESEAKGGRLSEFMEWIHSDEDIFDYVLCDIIALEFGKETDCYLQKIQEWMELTARLVENGNLGCINLHEELFINLFHYWKNKENEEKCMSCLEDYVNRMDMASYFQYASWIGVGPKDGLTHIFCTDNALYLLCTYIHMGRLEKAENLLQHIWEGIQLINRQCIDPDDRFVLYVQESRLYRVLLMHNTISSGFNEFYEKKEENLYSDLCDQIEAFGDNSNGYKLLEKFWLYCEGLYESLLWEKALQRCSDMKKHLKNRIGKVGKHSGHFLQTNLVDLLDCIEAFLNLGLYGTKPERLLSKKVDFIYDVAVESAGVGSKSEFWDNIAFGLEDSVKFRQTYHATEQEDIPTEWRFFLGNH